MLESELEYFMNILSFFQHDKKTKKTKKYTDFFIRFLGKHEVWHFIL